MSNIRDEHIAAQPIQADELDQKIGRMCNLNWTEGNSIAILLGSQVPSSIHSQGLSDLNWPDLNRI